MRANLIWLQEAHCEWHRSVPMETHSYWLGHSLLDAGWGPYSQKEAQLARKARTLQAHRHHFLQRGLQAIPMRPPTPCVLLHRQTLHPLRHDALVLRMHRHKQPVHLAAKEGRQTLRAVSVCVELSTVYCRSTNVGREEEVGREIKSREISSRRRESRWRRVTIIR